MKHSLLILGLVLPAAGYTQESRHQSHQHPALGVVHFVNSGRAAAQPSFQRGVALLHSFEYGDAAKAFQEARKADPALAVAYWLEALTYSHILWGEEDVGQARAVLQRLAPAPSARLAKASTERERAFGAAVEAFYADGPLPVRARAFADALDRMTTTYPDDAEAAAFAALSSMMAWYTSPLAERQRYHDPVRQHALRVFRANPQHPGAAHYLIHFVDMNTSAASEALEFARAYDKIAPDAEHALHMPSHVYLPLGMWEDVAAANERAWAAVRKTAIAERIPAADHSWHALEWLHYAYLQQGRYREARALIDTAHTLLAGAVIADDNPDARNIVPEMSFRHALETGDWRVYPDGTPSVDIALKQPRPNPRSWSFAVAAAYQAAVANLRARRDTAAVRRVISSFREEAGGELPEPRRAALQRLAAQLEAMLAFQRGDIESAVTELQNVASAEPAQASLPPTFIPSYELLGEYLLAVGRKAEAATAFEKALAARPNRAAPVRGLAQARQP